MRGYLRGYLQRAVGRIASVLAMAGVAASMGGCGAPLPLGEEELGRGDYEGAIAALDERLEADPEMVEKPAQRARIKALIGYCHAMLDKHAQSEATFNDLTGVIDELRDTKAAADVEVYRGLALLERGEMDEAAAVLTAAKDQLSKLGEGRSLEFGLSLAGAGAAHASLGNTAEGERLLTRAVPILRRYRSDYPVFFAEASTNLGTLLLARQHPEGARTHYDAALQTLRDAEIADHATLATALNGAAFVQYSTGNLIGAESNLDEAIEIFTRLEGANSPNVAKCYHDLGKVYATSGKIEEAEAAFEKSHEIYLDAFGSDHPFAKRALHSLADFLREQDREEEAAALLGEETAAAEQGGDGEAEGDAPESAEQ